MQRKRSRNTREANAAEKRFMKWVKDQDCVACGADGPSIVDHMYGATFKNNKVLIGHWALLPYCTDCDSIKTNGSHTTHLAWFGVSQADFFGGLWPEYWAYCGGGLPSPIPQEVIDAIMDWGK